MNKLDKYKEINYFGKPYSFTHIAAKRRFGKNFKYISKNTIEEAVNSVKVNSISVVPIENTYGGTVTDTVDALIEKKEDVKIIEELEMSIELYLLSKEPIELNKIKKILSHEYPLRIAEPWIKENIPGAKLENTLSTSEAVFRILKDEYICAIASSEAAEYYKLKTLAKINVDNKRNLTRFFVLGHS